MIMLYCVGIHFRKYVEFKQSLFDDPDPKYQPSPTNPNPPKAPKIPIPGYMSGADILAEAARLYHLRYQLTVGGLVPGHNAYLSWSPAVDGAHVPPMLATNNPPFRTTFGGVNGIFPFLGQPLSLTEVLAPIGEISRVLQYTVTPFTLETKPPTPPIPFPVQTTGNVGPPTTPPSPRGANAQFGSNGFPDNCEIRIRLVSIFCTA